MNSITLLSDAKYFEEGSTGVSHLRQLLDSKHPKEKLEAMKSLLARMTLGRDVSAFFPDVVKNVVVDHVEVKKLVYMYLIHYAEEKQDLALLTINTFQKDLQSPSQRIRANAMRAMSSIRIPVAIPLVMIALKTAVKDNSSYVRRAAASAIPKLFHCEGIEDDQRDSLIEFVEELLTNTEPIVLGAAMFAFQEVCPTRWELIHTHFRKVCHLLADFDDFGQQVALETLLRYGRTQFLSPFGEDDNNEKGTNSQRTHSPSPSAEVASSSSSPRNAPTKPPKKKEKAFYSDDEDDEDESNDGNESDENGSGGKKKKKDNKGKSKKGSDDDDDDDDDSYLKMKIGRTNASNLDETSIDEDHKLLLKQATLLLQTSNSGVLMAVVTLYWYLAPTSQLSKVIRPLVRMSRNKRSLMYVLLANISTMAAIKPDLFRPYLKDFFINATDPSYVRDLKLDIICHLATDLSMSVILKEFTAYCSDPDKEFVCKVIQSIGRCTQFIPTIAERAMNSLSKLVLSPTDSVVAQSVVVIVRQLLPFSPIDSVPIIVKRMTRLLDQVKIPMARTAIVWMIGEYREHITKLAPDALRKLCKSFHEEEISVKLQILNLAVKLFLSNPKQTSLIFKYVMDLCKYDVNYDLRDRARLFRTLFFKKKASSGTSCANANGAEAALGAPGEQGTEVKDSLKNVVLSPKPTPTIPEPFVLRHKYILGTLSHILSQPCNDYSPLPEFPLVAPDPTTRNPKPSQKELDEAEKEKKRLEKKERKKNKKKVKSSSSSSSSSSGDTASDESDSEASSNFSSFDSQSNEESESGDDSDSNSSGTSADSSKEGSNDSNESNEEEEEEEDGEREKEKDLEAAESDEEEEEEERKKKEKEKREREKREKERAKKEKEKAKGKTKKKDSDEEENEEEEDNDDDEELELDLSHEAQREKEKQKEREAKSAEKERKEKEKEKEKERDKNTPKDEDKKVDKKPSKPKSPEPADLLDFSAVNFETAPSSPSSTTSVPAASSASSTSPTTSPSSETKALDLTVPTQLEMKNLFPKGGLSGMLLNPVHSGGLQVDFAFSRKPSLYSKLMNAIDLRFTNHSNNAFTDIQMMEDNSNLRGDSMGLDEVGVGFNLQVGDTHDAKIHVAFKGKADGRVFTLFIGTMKQQMKLSPTVGELIRPHMMAHSLFAEKQKKLSGMQESTITVQCSNVASIPHAILIHFNAAPLAQHSPNVYRFAADLLNDDSVVLIQCTIKDASVSKGPSAVFVQVNCEDFMFAGHLVELAKKALLTAPQNVNV